MRPHPLVGPIAALLLSATACAGAEGAATTAAEAAARARAAEQASEQALRVLAPMVRVGLAELETSRRADPGRLHILSLEGLEVDLVLDGLAGAVEGRPTDSGLDLAAKWFLSRVRAHRLRAWAPGLAWGGGFRLAPLATRPSPVEHATASLRGVEEALLALQSEVNARSRRRVSQLAP